MWSFEWGISFRGRNVNEGKFTLWNEWPMRIKYSRVVNGTQKELSRWLMNGILFYFIFILFLLFTFVTRVLRDEELLIDKMQLNWIRRNNSCDVLLSFQIFMLLYEYMFFQTFCAFFNISYWLQKAYYVTKIYFFEHIINYWNFKINNTKFTSKFLWIQKKIKSNSTTIFFYFFCFWNKLIFTTCLGSKNNPLRSKHAIED